MTERAHASTMDRTITIPERVRGDAVCLAWGTDPSPAAQDDVKNKKKGPARFHRKATGGEGDFRAPCRAHPWRGAENRCGHGRLDVFSFPRTMRLKPASQGSSRSLPNPSKRQFETAWDFETFGGKRLFQQAFQHVIMLGNPLRKFPGQSIKPGQVFF